MLAFLSISKPEQRSESRENNICQKCVGYLAQKPSETFQA